MQLQYASLLLILRPTLASTWMCGIGPFSGAVAYLIALPTDTAGVNRCCIEHDTLIENFQIAREEADRVFCQCLSKTNNWWVIDRKIIDIQYLSGD
ncbi:unnamed protein product [Nippostrongylus brasiliensis]|uniref:Secreted protein n=1 Tax=Nippostrongylus brasiliensis TaxID=27835 RepID=A0A0N4XDZ6_NIPBR|nr:unnamed protein product [Nippostrongylus brasiliensis]